MELIKKYFWVFFVSMLPVIELRGAIPIGVGMGLPTLPVYAVAALGNMLPVPFLLLLALALLRWGMTLPGVGGFFRWVYAKGERAEAKLSEKVGAGQYVALFLFVAIPLPGTGAWTGSLAAALLRMKFWPSVLAIMAGVLTAGVIMAAVSLGVSGLVGLF